MSPAQLKKCEKPSMTAKTNPTVVIDTNLFISTIIRGGTPYKLLEAWKANKFILTTTQALFEEIAEVFTRDYIYQKYKLDQTNIQKLLDGLKLNAQFASELNLEDLPLHSRDPQDDKVLGCALGGNADYLVTGDEDLLVLQNNPALKDLNIVTVTEFLALI